MQISYNDWIRYKNMLAAIDEKAAELMVNWLASQGGYINVPKDKLISYAYALASKYGEASAAAAAQMYDEIAEASGVSVPAAEVAETATYGEMAKAINGVTKKLTTDSQIGNVVGRHVKLAGADTTLKNAIRDGAEFAWIPSGDTCAFCLMLASNGWQKASYKALKGHHAEHIHANCDCTYAIRFDGKSNVKGYDPEKYRRMYYGAEGDNWREKLNSIRRMKYAENPEKYRAQNRAWWHRHIRERKYKSDEGAFSTWDIRNKSKKYDIIKPHNIINDLNKTLIGQKSLELIGKYGTEVRLLYGADNRTADGMELLGYYDPFNNVIIIYADKTITVKKTAEIVVHEANHLEDFGPCQKSEVYCMIQEKRHEKGGSSLTVKEVSDIIKLVKDLYYDLPWR